MAMTSTETLFEHQMFSPEVLHAMVAAYERVCRELHDRGQPDIVKEVIAKRIIELVSSGVTEAEPVSVIILKEFGLPRSA